MPLPHAAASAQQAQPAPSAAARTPAPAAADAAAAPAAEHYLDESAAAWLLLAAPCRTASPALTVSAVPPADDRQEVMGHRENSLGWVVKLLTGLRYMLIMACIPSLAS